MDDLYKYIYEYVYFIPKPTMQGLNMYLIRNMGDAPRIKEIQSRLIVLKSYFEELENYEICHSIKLMLNEK